MTDTVISHPYFDDNTTGNGRVPQVSSGRQTSVPMVGRLARVSWETLPGGSTGSRRCSRHHKYATHADVEKGQDHQVSC